jgi:hypothetical protein
LLARPPPTKNEGNQSKPKRSFAPQAIENGFFHDDAAVTSGSMESLTTGGRCLQSGVSFTGMDHDDEAGSARRLLVVAAS